MAQRYRCTVCGVETMSSKACPRCGRRSTLVPVDRDSGPGEEEALGSGPEDAAGRDRGIRGTYLAVAVVVAVGAVVAAAVLATGQRPASQRGGGRSRGPAGAGRAGTPAKTRSADQGPPGMPKRVRLEHLCGQAYCLEIEMSTPKEQGGGVLETRHCFLLPKAPTPGRLWYVPVFHHVSWKGPEGKAEPLVQITPEESWASDRAKVWLGGLAADVVEGENPMGRKLFYLAERPLGFGMAAPPTVTRPLLLQFATLVFTAAALTPDPPEPGARSWVDRRPLALPLPCLPRKWIPSGRRAGEDRSWTFLPVKGDRKNSSGKPSEDNRIALWGRARFVPARCVTLPSPEASGKSVRKCFPARSYAYAVWEATKVEGRLALKGLASQCLDQWKHWAAPQ